MFLVLILVEEKGDALWRGGGVEMYDVGVHEMKDGRKNLFQGPCEIRWTVPRLVITNVIPLAHAT